MSGLNETSADPLESAFDSAFVAPPVRRQSLKEETPSSATTTESSGEPVGEPVAAASSAEPSAADSGEPSADDAWKEEYESQVHAWRAQSAEAREKAEQERLKWEAKRAIEKEEAAKRKAAGIVEEPVVEPWDKPAPVSATVGASVSTDTKEQAAAQTSVPAPVSEQESHTEGSQKWEEVHSLTSSFPSMTFPENIDTPPAQPQPKSSTEAPASATLAIFDSSLSNRTRAVAFFSALAVNLLLPFVNGVMLGFGEIFAKNVVMKWFGWSSGPGSTATNVGLRTSRKEDKRNPFSR